MKDAAEDKKHEKPKRADSKKPVAKAETEGKNPAKSRSRSKPKAPKNSAPPKAEVSVNKKGKEVARERSSSKTKSLKKTRKQTFKCQEKQKGSTAEIRPLQRRQTQKAQ